MFLLFLLFRGATTEMEQKEALPLGIVTLGLAAPCAAPQEDEHCTHSP